MKTLGIILAGGSGTRLAPMTTAVSKQLLPIYDKPMIYYPLTTLIAAGIKDILVITQSSNIDRYESLLGIGRDFGVQIWYADQDNPKGLAEAILIAGRACICARRTLNHYDNVCLILGDNLFHGGSVVQTLARLLNLTTGAVANIFVYRVGNPARYGVAELATGQQSLRGSSPWRVSEIVEKPLKPATNLAVPGLYLYGTDTLLEFAQALRPSVRGELEITDLNNLYANQRALFAHPLGAGAAWLDSGTPESLLEAAEYVRAIQERQGVAVGSPHIAAFASGNITAAELDAISSKFPGGYGDYLAAAADEV